MKKNRPYFEPCNEIMRHKNEIINTCKVQRPAKSMTSRKQFNNSKLHAIQMSNARKYTCTVQK